LVVPKNINYLTESPFRDDTKADPSTAETVSG
jgi:hypothetical protein